MCNTLNNWFPQCVLPVSPDKAGREHVSLIVVDKQELALVLGTVNRESLPDDYVARPVCVVTVFKSDGLESHLIVLP